MPKQDFSYTFNGLYTLVAYLTSPTGCKWDKKQTSRSLRTYLLEECYEVIDAIENENDTNLKPCTFSKNYPIFIRFLVEIRTDYKFFLHIFSGPYDPF